MITGGRLHAFEGASAGVRIAKDTPKMALLTFGVVGGDFVSVTLPRHSLERLVLRAQKAMKEAPLPARGRSTGPSATSRNK